MVKLKDIAETMNVSIGTVSKALRHSHEISIEMTDKIIRCANELGYIANSSARNLKTNKSYNIGVVYVDKTRSGLGHDYFSTMLSSIRDELSIHGYDFTFVSNLIGENKLSYLNHARYRRCDGVIVVTADYKDPEIIELVESEVPVVTIDQVFNNRSAILSDNEEGLSHIVNYVYQKGHRKIAFIHGEDTAVTEQRIASFNKACNDLKIMVNKDYIKPALYHFPKQAGLMTRTLLALDDRPTCIIYPDDYSFMGGLTEIEKHGLKIPEDISVVGYDGIFLSRILRPVLTSYVQNSVEIGKQAVLKMLEQLEKPKSFVKKPVKVKGSLQEGQTVKDIHF
ncbi:MAG TPA: LacI family DNA-binding transcriptional regulator [Acholeplasma sp.]|nr:LacI family DNA-binding transcriptional regulator [Acholeplasma sp.]